jgi:hypothetical protein
MGIAAELDHEPTVRSRSKIGSHDSGSSAVEVPRRGSHPPVAKRKEIGDPDLILGEDRRQGIMPALVLPPMSQDGPRRASSRDSACFPPLVARRWKIV